MIMGKKDSYAQMKETFVWMKDNLPNDSIILGIGIEPYTIYYSELMPIEHESWMNEGILNKSIKLQLFLLLTLILYPYSFKRPPPYQPKLRQAK